MKLGKYLVAELLSAPPGEKTQRWAIYSNSQTAQPTLGTIEWLSRWRQYTFDPVEGATFSAGCLRDIAEFLQSQNAAHADALEARAK